MELLFEAPGILIGLIGWAATALLIFDSSRLNLSQRRVLLIPAWMIWMIPAFNALVHRGLLTGDAAILACGGMTVALMLIVSLSAVRVTRH